MSFDPPWGGRRPERPDRRNDRTVIAPRRRSPLVPTIAVVVGVVLLVVLASRLWVNVLWFDAVGYLGVFTTTLAARSVLFVVAAVLTGGAVAASLSFAYRRRPIYAPVSPEQASLDRYREQIEPLRRAGMVVVPAAVALIAGAAASERWQVLELFLHRQPFGTKDPQFALDVGFFVFTLPFLRLILSLLTAAVVLSAIAAFVVHYLYGGLRLQGGDEKTTTAARVHLSLLIGLFVLLRGAGYWLDRYSLTTARHSLARDFTGMTYTDVNAVLPAKMFLAIAAVVVGLVFVASIWLQSWRLPMIGAALLVICAIVAGGIVPAVVQRFQVKPSEQNREAKFISRNIAATRTAYGLTNVEVQNYDAKTDATTGQLRADANTVPGIRLLDPARVPDAFRQLEQVRGYYAFPDSLDVDRYRINGASRDTVIAVRELQLTGVPDAQRNWVNDHTTYTHGFGVVAAYGNQRTSDGKPVFSEGDIPPVGVLGKYEPRIYFGEQSPSYSIVGAPANQAPVEFDYPDASSSGERRTSYTGKGGVAMGSFPRRLAFAISQQDLNILVSDRINARSRILFDRHPRERVEKVAPWLSLDGDPYPAVVNGRVQWILDGYTTSDAYPNSQNTTLQAATSDSLTQRSSSVAPLANRRVNYIRNSVKATVDAYDGTVTLYAWDANDPVLKAWMGVFKNTVKPMSQISGQLMAHLRYPEDLFKVQRALLSRYHVSDAQSFYSGNDFWRVPDDPTAAATTATTNDDQPPYFLTLQMPGQPAPSFSLTSTFIPAGGARNVLTAFAAVDADAGSQGGRKREGYGKIRVLQLPRDAVVSGPGQVQNNFNANPAVSQNLNLLRQGNSKVESGNLLTLPVGGGLLYVQPVYVRGAGNTSYPLLQKVLVSFGDKIGFADTLDQALDQVFGGDSGASAGDAGTPGASGGGTTGNGGGATQTPQQRLRAALAEAQQAITDGQAALAKGDFAGYGQAQQRLQQALQRALDAEAAASRQSTPAPTPSGSPSTPPASPSATAAPSATPTSPAPSPTSTGSGG